ncbi:putative membrane protein [Catalinimonas alkaloidigena]|uniref:Putative membrane protein n=1 Tax=Catalinimonas alkaloidigena TaxID=1075417 RepID=A0A1G8XU59_9BACT|nr:phage holin family protein [Catalinimonas alkaloidigena]SDJ93704.1 putative membrane protein [Catalinimonas alkaloidigena]
MEFIVSTLIYAVAVFATAYLLPGVKVNNFGTAILAALLLLLANAVVKPILVVLTIPITILTLGLFLLVINALIVMLVDKLLTGMEIKNFGWAVAFSVVLSIISSVLNWIF